MIRQIEKKDIPDCVEVITTSFMTIADQFGITPDNAPAFTAYATDAAKIEHWMEEQHRPMFGYYVDDILVGYYNLYLPNSTECELGSLCVLPGYRHSGIGDILLNDAISRAASLGCSKMLLSIVEENKVLRKWYEDHGFVHTGIKKYDFFPFTCGYLEMKL
ncbi:Acetyltransferase (GNAT) family protein [Ruminococcaceae bacterium YRB3002]|nr:Acetyltransferase (GNAT) family protein [Ruminococcaceae bacterium YRB3002]